jgi:hypothetical protein
MARKPEPMDEDRLRALVDSKIQDAISFDALVRETPRRLGLAYAAGEVPDLKPAVGFSSVVSQDIADAKSQLMPSLMRIFTASDNVFLYEPQKPEDEAFADQVTDYVNQVFLRDCDGEQMLRDLLDDGLGLGNGIVKHWWDNTKEYATETLTGLDDEALRRLLAPGPNGEEDPDIEVLEHSEYLDPAAPPPAPAGPMGSAGVPGQPPMAAPGGPQPSPLGGMPAGQPDPAAAGQASLTGPMAPPAMAAPMVPGVPPDVSGASVSPLGSGPDLVQSAGGDLGTFADPRLGIGGNFPPEPIAVPMLHDIKIRRVVSHGRISLIPLADEDFGIESGATGLNERECSFCYHRETPTRSELLERGHKPELVDELVSVDGVPADRSYRRGTYSARTEGSEDGFEDRASERVEVFECYAKIDYDGDGITEWHQIVVGGASGSRRVLRREDWGSMLPFSDIVPDPVPHVWRGRSLYDRLRDVQRVNTVLWRKTLDNTYQVVEPGRVADMRYVLNKDAVFNRALGQVIQVNGDPRSVFAEDVIPSIAQFTMPLVDEMRKIAERRVGVGDQSTGLDTDALSGQVATAVAATQSGSALRKEDYARNIAVGVRRIGRAMLRLSVEHQDKPRTLLLRGKWVTVDPRSWNASMNVTVNVGLGNGNRDRDLAMMQGVTGKQEQIMQVLGPDNGWVGLEQYGNGLTAMAEAAGIKGVDRFFPAVTPEMMQAMAAKAAQKAAQPDPKTAAAQAQAQVAAQKAQADQQLAQAKAQADMGLQQAKAQAEAQLATARMQQDQQAAQIKLEADMRVREAEAQHAMDLDRAKAQNDLVKVQLKAQADAEIARAKMEAQLEIDRIKAENQMALKQRELEIEAGLKQQQFALGLNRGDNVEFPA